MFINRWVHKIWCIYTIEYSLAISEILIHAECAWLPVSRYPYTAAHFSNSSIWMMLLVIAEAQTFSIIGHKSVFG